MTAPKRPSLADTIARIDAALAEGDTFTVTEPGVYEVTWSPALREEARRSAARLADIVERHNAAVAAPPEPDWVTFEPHTRPGRVRRALRRLFAR
jgi:hypothetical protein